MDGHYYPIENGEQIALLSCSLVFSSLTIAAVALRFTARVISHHVIHWSDYLVLVSSVSTVAYWVTLMIDAFTVGQGTEPTSKIVDPELALEYQFILNIMWLVNVYLVKVAILGLYMIVFTLPNELIAIRFLMVFTVACGLASVIGMFALITPLRAWWDMTEGLWTVEDERKLVPFSIFLDTSTCVIDFVIFIIPLKLLWTLKMRWQRKMGLLFAFGFGLLTCCMTLVRAVLDANNGSETVCLILNGIEPSMGIVAACLPLLHPLLGRNSQDAASGSKSQTVPRSRNTNGIKMNTFNAMRRKGAHSKKGQDPDKDLFESMASSITTTSHRKPSEGSQSKSSCAPPAAIGGAASPVPEETEGDPPTQDHDEVVFNKEVSWGPREVHGPEAEDIYGVGNHRDDIV